MRFVAINTTFEDEYTLEDMCQFIFATSISFSDMDISEVLKYFRRYRTYIIGIHRKSGKIFRFTFSFPYEKVAQNFKKEFNLLVKEPPN